MNKGFLFATSSRKIKSHVVESQITLPVRPCFSLTEKQRTINHMIIFNYSISKFTSVAFEVFAEAYLCFLVYASAKKKKCRGNWIFKNLKKNMSPRKKYIFVLKRRHRNNVRPSLFIRLAKVKQQNEWKKRPGISEYGPWILTGQINGHTQELLLRRSCCFIFAPSQKS